MICGINSNKYEINILYIIYRVFFLIYQQVTIVIIDESQFLFPHPPPSETEGAFRDAAAAVSACAKGFHCSAAF